MFAILLTGVFRKWRDSLRDSKAKAAIARRIDRLALGNAGDAKAVGEGVSELRIDHGPGYRLYFMRSGEMVIVLLCGGDKSTQARDIAKAKEIAESFKEEDDEGK
jgi:putative addiction module killer protein